jgi:oligosaccharide repeat unit polymerase
MLVNPALIYAYIWLLALFLYTRYWSEIFLPLSNATLAYILSSIVVVGLAWAVMTIIFIYHKLAPIKKNENLIKFSLGVKKKILFLTYVWCIFSIVELLYHRDLPILAVFGIGSMTYHTYGIPSLHGLLNAIILALSMYSLYFLIETKNKKYFFIYILTIVPFILTMSRGGMTSLLLQSLFVLLLFKRVKISSIVKFVVLFFIFIFIFGFLGEIRNINTDADIYQVFQMSSDYPDFLPRGFTWIYMYLSTPINNIENIFLLYDNWNFEPYIVLFRMLPTFVRDILPIPNSIVLVNNAFNVSSFMPKYLAAFGVYGSLVFYFISALVPLYFYQKFIRTREIKYGFILVVFLHSIVLSVFSGFFLIQTYIFEILLQYFIFNKIVVRVRKNKLRDNDNFYKKDAHV